MSKSKAVSVDRREFLKVAAGGAATLVAGASLTAAQQNPVAAAPERLRIDIHGHYFPNDYLDMLDRFGGGHSAGYSIDAWR